MFVGCTLLFVLPSLRSRRRLSRARYIRSDFSQAQILLHLFSMEVPESLDRIGGFAPASSVTFSMPVKWTEIPDSEEVRRINQASLSYQLRRESFSEEERCMMYQARLGNRLRRHITRRLLYEAQSSSVGSSDGNKSTTSGNSCPLPVELKKHKDKVIKLTNLVMYPMAVGYPVTLEAHVNGFTFTGDGFSTVIMNADVQGCFVGQVGGASSPHLVFYLQHPILVGSIETKVIHFSFLICTSRLSLEFKNFVQEVYDFHWGGGCCNMGPIAPIAFEEIEDCEFLGVLPTGKLADFALTYSALLVLEERPFSVFPLRDIQIVNFALTGPDDERMEMAVIFRDVKCGVLVIRSIKSEILTMLKHRLNSAHVKYYVNHESRDWNLVAEEMFASGEGFMRETSCLEDPHTLAYYEDEDSGSDSELLEKYGSVQL